MTRSTATRLSSCVVHLKATGAGSKLLYLYHLGKKKNYTVLSSRLEICSVSIATRGSRRAAPKVGKVTYVNDTRFPTAPRILVSRHIFVFFTLDSLTTDVAQSGKRQVPFLKPHLVTNTRLTSKKYEINVFSFPRTLHYTMVWSGFKPGTSQLTIRHSAHNH